MVEPLGDFRLAKPLVGRRERVDRRHDETLWRGQLLGVFGHRQYDGVVTFDERRKIGPQISIGRRKLHMAPPHPQAPLSHKCDERERLWIVNDHQIMVEVHPRGVLEDNFFVNGLL